MKPNQFFVITRAWSFIITFISVSVGTAIAYQEKQISIPLYILCLVGAFAIHGAANVLNDYFDLKNKIDSPGSPTTLYRPHPVFTHMTTQKELLSLAIFLLTFSGLCATALAIFISPWLWLIFALGFCIAIFYTAGKKPLKYTARGEITVFLAFGPLLMEGTYIVQTSALSLKVLVLSVPIGIFVAAILLVNNLRDAVFDRSTDIMTLATVLSPARAFKLYSKLIFYPFILTAIYVILGILQWPSLAVFAACPLAIKTIKEFSKKIPDNADGTTSVILFIFGTILAWSLIV
jgi:1,4-dihydroxy-2-naphthoate octaprenyltransferase